MASANFQVQVDGLKELMERLSVADQRGERVATEAIQRAGERVLADARSRASAFSRSGAFKGSLSIKDLTSGISLVSTDPGGGVIEYANRGAVATRGKHVGRRVGVPAGSPPRSMIPAIEDNQAYVVNEVTSALERALNGVG